VELRNKKSHASTLKMKHGVGTAPRTMRNEYIYSSERTEFRILIAECLIYKQYHHHHSENQTRGRCSKTNSFNIAFRKPKLNKSTICFTVSHLIYSEVDFKALLPLNTLLYTACKTFFRNCCSTGEICCIN